MYIVNSGGEIDGSLISDRGAAITGGDIPALDRGSQTRRQEGILDITRSKPLVLQKGKRRLREEQGT